jgi:hypothetical protein
MNVRRQNVRRVIRKTKAQIQAEHQDYLKRMGYYPNPKGTRVVKMPDYSTNRSVPTSDRVVPIDYGSQLSREQKLATSSGYTIGQAYNKGGLVVLSKKEAEDTATGKRRA